jgi:DNA-binding transcriptional LysR family regulator
MELRQIEALITVAEVGSFTQAAENLNISQPSLSARIRRLERSLETSLIDRATRPVELTPQGEAFISYAKRALDILVAGQEFVGSQQMATTAVLKIGCPFSVATYLLPDVIDQFSRKFPQAELSIETGNSDFVVRQLNDGLINLAVAAAFPKFAQQTRMLLRLHDEMTAGAPQAHPFTLSSPIPISQIWSNRVLLIHWGQEFQAYLESLRQLSPDPGPLVRLPLAGALPMARQPNTITFMPRRLLAPSELVEIFLQDFAFAWDIAVMTRSSRRLSHLERAFLDIILQSWEASVPT